MPWLLRELSKGVVRINCGGEEYTTSSGEVWSKDRFFQAGFRFFGDVRGGATEPFTGEIHETPDDPLYQTERWFPEASEHGGDYRVPLPPGRYRLRLYFAEIFFRDAALRRFDVLVEDTVVLKDYVPGTPGFATAGVVTFLIPVRDGFLDVQFIRGENYPKISAIKIEKDVSTDSDR